MRFLDAPHPSGNGGGASNGGRSHVGKAQVADDASRLRRLLERCAADQASSEGGSPDRDEHTWAALAGIIERLAEFQPGVRDGVVQVADLVQAACEKLQKLSNLERALKAESPVAYLRSVIRHTALDLLGWRKPKEHGLISGADVDGGADDGTPAFIENEALRAALSQLTPRQRSLYEA